MRESRRDETGSEPKTSTTRRYSNQPFANGVILPPLHPGWQPGLAPIQARLGELTSRGELQSILLPGESAGITPPKSGTCAKHQAVAPFIDKRAELGLSLGPTVSVENPPPVPTTLCGAATPISVALLPQSKGAETLCDPRTSPITQILDVEFLVRKTLARDFPQEAVNPYFGGGVSGTGNVLGPSVSTDNAVARFDGTTGTRIQNSGLIVDDVAPVTGYVVHTPDPAGTLAEALLVRPGNPTGVVTGPGAKLTLRGGDAGPVAGPFAGGDVEISGGDEPSGGPSGSVLIGPLSLDLNTPRLAAQGDTNTGVSFLGGDVLALVTNGAYALAIDQDRVVETTSGRRLTLFRTSADVTLTSANDIVIVTGNHAITLEPAPLGGQRHIIRNGHSAAITVDANGNDFNDSGSGTLTLPPGSGAEIEWDSSGLTWWVTLATASNGGLGDPGANGLVVRTALGVTTARSIAVSSKLSITDADGVAGNPTLDVTEANLTLNNIGGTLSLSKGGTGSDLSAASTGALYLKSAIVGASTSLPDVATGNALLSGGVNNLPSYGKVGLTTHVSGILPEGNGGTNQSAYSTGDMLYASGANTLAKRAIGTTGQVLTVSGGVPTWATPTAVDNGIMDFRLCGASGTPVPTSDTTTISTLYLTPYKGNRIALYYSSAWQLFTTAEVSKALSSLTSGKPYDVFAYYDGSAVQLEFLVWTNDTTRATALAYQDGVLVKSGDSTRRYIGSFYTTAANATTWVTVADLASTTVKAYIWNYYNRVRFALRLYDSTNSFTYSSTIQAWNGSANAKLNVICGLAESSIDISAMAVCSMNNTGGGMFTCIGYDSTAAATTGGISHQINSSASNRTLPLSAHLNHVPATGFHYYSWLHGTSTGATWTWYGDGGVTGLQSGMNAIWEA